MVSSGHNRRSCTVTCRSRVQNSRSTTHHCDEHNAYRQSHVIISYSVSLKTLQQARIIQMLTLYRLGLNTACSQCPLYNMHMYYARRYILRRSQMWGNFQLKFSNLHANNKEIGAVVWLVLMLLKLSTAPGPEARDRYGKKSCPHRAFVKPHSFSFIPLQLGIFLWYTFCVFTGLYISKSVLSALFSMTLTFVTWMLPDQSPSVYTIILLRFYLLLFFSFFH